MTTKTTIKLLRNSFVIVEVKLQMRLETGIRDSLIILKEISMRCSIAFKHAEINLDRIHVKEND